MESISLTRTIFAFLICLLFILLLYVDYEETDYSSFFFGKKNLLDHTAWIS